MSIVLCQGVEPNILLPSGDSFGIKPDITIKRRIVYKVLDTD